MRKFVLASLVTMEFMTEDMPAAARDAATTRATGYVGEAISGLTGTRSQLGLSAERVKKADESLEAQNKIIETHLNDLESVDAYRSEEHTSELQSLMRISYAVFCLKKKTITTQKK